MEAENGQPRMGSRTPAAARAARRCLGRSHVAVACELGERMLELIWDHSPNFVPTRMYVAGEGKF